jgi:hypothetical protein
MSMTDQYAGKVREDPPLPIKHEPYSDGSPRCDSAKYLTPRRRFQNAAKPISVISFASWSDEDFARVHRMILRSMCQSPGSFVFGETCFLSGDSPDEAHAFLTAAGFAEADRIKLLPEGWSSLLR